MREGETSWGVSSGAGGTNLLGMSGRGGKVAMSVELKSGHAPGKEGVGEAATIMLREREQQEKETGASEIRRFH
jgi:hypothetical protein